MTPEQAQGRRIEPHPLHSTRYCVGVGPPFQGGFTAILLHRCYTDVQMPTKKGLTANRRKSLSYQVVRETGLEPAPPYGD